MWFSLSSRFVVVRLKLTHWRSHQRTVRLLTHLTPIMKVNPSLLNFEFRFLIDNKESLIHQPEIHSGLWFNHKHYHSRALVCQQDLLTTCSCKVMCFKLCLDFKKILNLHIFWHLTFCSSHSTWVYFFQHRKDTTRQKTLKHTSLSASWDLIWHMHAVLSLYHFFVFCLRQNLSSCHSAVYPSQSWYRSVLRICAAHSCSSSLRPSSTPLLHLQHHRLPPLILSR